MTRLGLEEIIAQNEEAYVQIGMELAASMRALENLRAGLRSRMRSSALCDGKSFARTMENTFQKAWQNRCQKNDQSENITNEHR
jgi:predicted O-linked N-acetylglucosamine transferase (SPINDLY family)